MNKNKYYHLCSESLQKILEMAIYVRKTNKQSLKLFSGATALQALHHSECCLGKL